MVFTMAGGSTSWLKDITPTIAYLMGLSAPRGANGRIVREIIVENRERIIG